MSDEVQIVSGNPGPDEILAIRLALKICEMGASFGPGSWIDPAPELRVSDTTSSWRSTVW